MSFLSNILCWQQHTEDISIKVLMAVLIAESSALHSCKRAK